MALNLFMKIGDIMGDSTDKNHKDEIVVMSWNWGVAMAGGAIFGAGSGVGKPEFSELTFIHHIDKASPNLFKACATGKHMKDAKLSVRKATSPQEFFVITMNDVTIMHVTPSSTTADTSMVESVGLRFGRVDMEYKSQLPDGTLDAGVHFTYDIQTNQIV